MKDDTDVTVSIALATFNGERYLEAQLRSLAQQTLLPEEIVVGDDGSSDSTRQILDDFRRHAPFTVRVFHNEPRLGFAVNFLTTAERCKGQLVAFCDQDDVWLPHKLAACVGLFKAHSEIRAVVHSAEMVDATLAPIGRQYPVIDRTRVEPVHSCDPWLLVPGFTLVFDAALLRMFAWRTRPPSRDLDALSHAMDHDEWVYFVASSSAAVGFLAEPLALYRQHESSFVGAPDNSWTNRARRLLNEDFASQDHRGEISRRYATDLRRNADRIDDGIVATNVRSAADRWDAYAGLVERRDSLYGTNMCSRLRTLSHLARCNAYRAGNQGGLGRHALLRDIREIFLPGRGAKTA